MKELELKYGCNPNQKPTTESFQSRCSADVQDILTFWMRSMDGSWYQN